MKQKELEKNILECINDDSDVIIWDIVKSNIVRLPLKIKSINTYSKVIMLDIEPGHHDVLSKFMSGDGFLRFYISDLKLAFVSKMSAFHGNRLEVGYPIKSRQFERRQSERFDSLSPVYLFLGKNKFEVMDISATGVSLVLGSSQYDQYFKPLLNTGMKCIIGMDTSGVLVKAEIIDNIPIRPYQINRFPYGAHRLSIFLESTPEFRQLVKKLVDGQEKLLKDLS